MSDTTRTQEILAAHERKGGLRDAKIHCTCGWSESILLMWSSKASFSAHVAAMLAPLFAEARAEAWDEGHQAGFTEHQNPGAFVNDWWDSNLPNPYRSTK